MLHNLYHTCDSECLLNYYTRFYLCLLISETSDTEEDTNHSADNSTSTNSGIREVEVYLSDAEPEAFQLVLSYIYTDRIHPQKLKGLQNMTGS